MSYLLGNILTTSSTLGQLYVQRNIHPDGRPLRPNSVTRALKRIGESGGLNGIRLHDLRHAHASILLRQVVHPKIVQERLGHSSISTTLDIYSHLLPGLVLSVQLVSYERFFLPLLL